MLESQLLETLRNISVSPATADWIGDTIRTRLSETFSRHTASRDAIRKALDDANRESETLLTLRLRGQVGDDVFESRRLGLLDRQAKLQVRLDQPASEPDELLRRVQDVLRFHTSLPRSFLEGNAVRRRQIAAAVCANWTVKDKKALYKAKEPFSFFEGAGRIRSWYPVVERLRTWIVQMNFQIPKLLLAPEEQILRVGVHTGRTTGTGPRPKPSQTPDVAG